MIRGPPRPMPGVPMVDNVNQQLIIKLQYVVVAVCAFPKLYFGYCAHLRCFCKLRILPSKDAKLITDKLSQVRRRFPLSFFHAA